MTAQTNVDAIDPSTASPTNVRVPQGKSSTMSTRLIGLAGMLSFDLIVVAAFVSPPLWNAPGTNSSGRAVASFAQHSATCVTTSLFLYSLAMALFLCFAAGLWGWLRNQEPSPQTLSSIFGFAAIALIVLILAGFVPAYMLGYRDQPAIIAGPLGDLTFGLLALSGIPTAVCLGTYAALVMRLRCLPLWTGWVAAIGTFAHLMITASFLSHGMFLSLESPVIVWVPATFFGWILAASTAVFRIRADSY